MKPQSNQLLNDRGWIASNVAAGRIQGIPVGEGLHVVERFTLVQPDRIDYDVTIEDQAAYTAPWTVAIPWRKDNAPDRILEYGCHEGNYGLANILSGARARDRAAAEKASAAQTAGSNR